MFLPLGDAPNYSHVRPWVNWGLIAANVVAFLVLKATAGDEAGWQRVILEHGFVPVAPSLSDFFSGMFLHADAMHLAGNMLFLWIFGDNVEGRLGHVGYLFAYLASGLAATLFFWALSRGSTIPCVGASGAIFGVEGYYFVAFGRNVVRVVYWVIVLGVVWVPARLVIGLSLLTNLLLMLRPEGARVGGGVAYAAHVGGAVLGILLALALRPYARGEILFEAGPCERRLRRAVLRRSPPPHP